jgi:hypothetical protein
LAAAALLATSLSLAACGGSSAASATPSALASSPSTYDGQSVSVNGTAKNPHARKMKRGGVAYMYQLCDAQCINVIQFGANPVTDGTSIAVTGTFHATFGRVHQQNNVLVVGGRAGGWRGGAGGGAEGSSAPAGTASPAS